MTAPEMPEGYEVEKSYESPCAHARTVPVAVAACGAIIVEVCTRCAATVKEV